MKRINYFKKIIDTNWGRDCGWFIEYNNQTIVELIPYKEKIFRNSYILDNVKDDFKHILNFNEEEWHSLDLYYRNKKFKENCYSISEVIGPAVSHKDGTLILSYRFLSISIEFKNLIDKLIYKVMLMISR